jgi:hypothetical protein
VYSARSELLNRWEDVQTLSLAARIKGPCSVVRTTRDLTDPSLLSWFGPLFVHLKTSLLV